MIYRTNFDYEYQLAAISEGKKYQANNKVNEEFSYLFLWLESGSDKTLLSSRKFSNEFLDKLESITHGAIPNVINKLSEGKVVKNWWGKLDNVEMELNLNSKCWQNNIFTKKGTIPFIIGRNIDPNDNLHNSHGMLFRPNYSFAGKKAFRIKENTSINERGVLTEFYNKKFDISCYVFKNKARYYINEISSNFSFSKCLVFQDNSEVEKYCRRYKIDFSKVESSFQKAWEYLKSLYPNLESIQIDGIYTEDNKFFINELNYRKSMGQVALSFLKYFPNIPKLNFNLALKNRFNRPKEAVILSPENYSPDKFVSFINY